MKLPSLKFPLLIFLFLLPSFLQSQTNEDPALALPDSIAGWKAVTDRSFNNETLFDYIDGGAELFLSFGFSKVFNRIYSDGRGNEIFADIFYMNTPHNAYGVFLLSTDKVDNSFGQQSQISPGAAIFWKKNFYISITANRETSAGNKIINLLAEILDKAITGTSSLPPVISLLPEKGLNKESIRYFRHYIWLNSHFFISNDDILNINQNTEAVTAKYGEGEEKMVIVIIDYPSAADMETASIKFIQAYNPLLEKKGTVETNGKWIKIMKVGKCFIALFNCASEKEAEEAMSRAVERIKKQSK